MNFDKISPSALVPVGAVIVFFIMQGWATGNVRRPEQYGEVPPTGSPEDDLSMIGESEFNKGEDGRTAGGENYQNGDTTRVQYPDVVTGGCPVGYKLETLNTQRGQVQICREIVSQ
jgi:hypothetical protein